MPNRNIREQKNNLTGWISKRWPEIAVAFFLVTVVVLTRIATPPRSSAPLPEASKVEADQPNHALPLTPFDTTAAVAATAKRLALINPPPFANSVSPATGPKFLHQAFRQTPGSAVSQPIDPPQAKVTIGGIAHELSPNSIGSYPRYTVEPKSMIPIELELDPHETVDLQALDGGALNAKYSTVTGSADDQGQFVVNFSVAENPGSYRVVVLRSGTRSIFDFWVGAPLPPRVSSNP